MQKGLLECFKELKTVWNSVTKHAFKLTGDCDMDKLKQKLNEREKTNTVSVYLTYTPSNQRNAGIRIIRIWGPCIKFSENTLSQF